MTSLTFENCVFEQLDNGTLSLSEYHGEGGVLSIPKLVERIPVSQVDADAFSQGGPVTAFDVPIDHPYFSEQDGVLYNREGNALVRYPAGRTDETFSVPPSVHDLRHSAFEGAKHLKAVFLPETLGGMGSHAFSDCEQLEQIRLPDSLSRMGRAVFRGCVSLKQLEVSPAHPFFRRVDSFLINLQERSLVLSMPALTGNAVNVPQDILQIGEFAFVQCSRLEKVTLHHGLRSIGRYAFYHCADLREISFPSSLRSIGSRAFADSNILCRIVIPVASVEIELDAFEYSNNLYILAPDGGSVETFAQSAGIPFVRLG